MTRKTIKIKRGEGPAATPARHAGRAELPAASGHLVFLLCLGKKNKGKKIVVLRRYHVFGFFFGFFYRGDVGARSRAPPTSGAIHKIPFIYRRLFRVHGVTSVAVLI